MALLRVRRAIAWLRRFPWLLLRLGKAGGGRAVGVLSIWLWWERFTTRHWDVKTIRPGGVMRYSVGQYSGQPVTLRDGTVVQPGDRVVEIHLDNQAVSNLVAAGSSPFKELRLMAADIRALSSDIVAGQLGDVRAIHGISLFAEVSPRLGFEVRRLPRTFHWALVKYFLVGLLIAYHPTGFQRANQLRQSIWPGEIWMGWEAIRRRAGKRPD